MAVYPVVFSSINSMSDAAMKREVEAQEAKGRPKTTKLAGEEIKNETKPGIPEPAEWQQGDRECHNYLEQV